MEHMLPMFSCKLKRCPCVSFWILQFEKWRIFWKPRKIRYHKEIQLLSKKKQFDHFEGEITRTEEVL